jgi:hypothetical protein
MAHLIPGGPELEKGDKSKLQKKNTRKEMPKLQVHHETAESRIPGASPAAIKDSTDQHVTQEAF